MKNELRAPDKPYYPKNTLRTLRKTCVLIDELEASLLGEHIHSIRKGVFARSILVIKSDMRKRTKSKAIQKLIPLFAKAFIFLKMKIKQRLNTTKRNLKK